MFGRMATGWRDLQEEHYRSIGSQRSARAWTETVVKHLLEISHSQWVSRNQVVHERDRDGLKVKEGAQLEMNIDAQFSLGIEDLHPRDHHYILRGRESVIQMGAQDRLTWLHGITLARQTQSAHLASELQGMRDFMNQWLVDSVPARSRRLPFTKVRCPPEELPPLPDPPEILRDSWDFWNERDFWRRPRRFDRWVAEEQGMPQEARSEAESRWDFLGPAPVLPDPPPADHTDFIPYFGTGAWDPSPEDLARAPAHVQELHRQTLALTHAFLNTPSPTQTHDWETDPGSGFIRQREFEYYDSCRKH